MTTQELYRWVDGRLTAAVQEQLEQHLAGCPPCQAQAASVRQVQQLLRVAEPVVQPSAAFDAGFWQKATARPEGVWPWLDVRSWVPSFRFGHAVATAAMALVIGGVGGIASTLTEPDTSAPFPRSLSGFEERMGVPITSVTVSYLNTLDGERSR